MKFNHGLCTACGGNGWIYNNSLKRCELCNPIDPPQIKPTITQPEFPVPCEDWAVPVIPNPQCECGAFKTMQAPRNSPLHSSYCPWK